MNSQREVIYRRRRNALYGERLQVDILNAFYEVAQGVVENNPGNYEGFKLNALQVFGFQTKIASEAFQKTNAEPLTAQLYQEAVAHYNAKNALIVEKTLPIIREVHAQRGATTKEIIIPFTNGTHQLQVIENLEKYIATEGKSLIDTMQQAITLAIIDQEWKEHLREMDELKEQVQNARFEQKDPLLIYKFEAFKLFKDFVSSVNNDLVGFLAKATLPVQDPQQIEEARRSTQRQSPKVREQKAESGSVLSGRGASAPLPDAPPREVEITKPIRKEKLPNRNDRVTVRYGDGTMKKDVKFKVVEQDVLANRCILVE